MGDEEGMTFRLTAKAFFIHKPLAVNIEYQGDSVTIKADDGSAEYTIKDALADEEIMRLEELGYRITRMEQVS